jgi:MFS family permease
MLALWALPPRHETEPPAPRLGMRKAAHQGWGVLRSRGLLAFVVCVVLFHGGNAFILPLAVTRLTNRIGDADSNLILAACLIISQSTVALISPYVGHLSEAWGRRPVLLIGFAAVPLHAGLLALAGGPAWIIGLQVLDGVGGAMFGVMQPLIAADVTHGTNRLNLCMGVLGLAAALGAATSSAVTGAIATKFGDAAGFLTLAGAGLAALLAVLFLMPETRRRHAVRSKPG